MPAPSDDLVDLRDRTVLVTGANSGIGLEAARCFSAAGAQVVLGCRDTAKGERAAGDIRRTARGDVQVLALDLADLASVASAAAALGARHDRLDLLVNNAGVMWLPFRMTPDGFELQFATNHLGHFALTGQLLDLLLAAPAPRVVTVSSILHRGAVLDLDNLDGSRGYDPRAAYGASKLANLLFTFELQRRAVAAGSVLTATAAHPGWSATNLLLAGPRMAGSRIAEMASRIGNAVLAQSPAAGARATVVAAAGRGLRGGELIGPAGPGQLRGRPAVVRPSVTATDPALAARLWAVSESLTGVDYGRLAGAPA